MSGLLLRVMTLRLASVRKRVRGSMASSNSSAAGSGSNSSVSNRGFGLAVAPRAFMMQTWYLRYGGMGSAGGDAGLYSAWSADARQLAPAGRNSQGQA